MLTSDTLSPDARRAFISVVDRLIRAIDLYRVDGSDGLQETIDMAAGTLRRESDSHPPADRKERWWGKLLVVLGTVSVFCANANDVADFGKNVLEIGTSIYDIIDMDTSTAPPGNGHRPRKMASPELTSSHQALWTPQIPR